MLCGLMTSTLLAQTNIDPLFTDDGYWPKSAEAVAAAFPDFQWETTATTAMLKNDDIRLWNRDVEGFNMTSRGGHLRSLNVNIQGTDSKSDFTEMLETWVAVFDANLKTAHSKSPSKSKDGANVLTYRWKQENYYVYLRGSSKGGAYSVDLEYRPKVVADAPASVRAEQDKFDGIYERNFYNPDYSKSFSGRIVGFDESKQTIAVQTKKSKINVPLDQLSERDLAYYEEIKDLVIASKSLGVSIKETADKATREGRAITRNTYFEVTLANRSATKIENIEVKYTTYYKRDTLDGPPVLTSETGSYEVASLYGNYRETSSTTAIPITKESRPGMSGG